MKKLLIFLTFTGALAAFVLISSRPFRWGVVLSRVRAEFPSVAQLSTSELAAWLADASREPPVLLDVRAEAEYLVSHLPGARRVEPGSSPVHLLPSLARDRAIVAYCSVGYRSAAYAERMMQEGFVNVSNLEGSIFLWANEGHTVVRAGQPVRQVHPYNNLWGRLLEPEMRADAPPVPGSP